MILRILKWLLLTIQFKNLKAYTLYEEEQERRKDDFESPFERTWVFWFQKLWWSIKHRRAIGVAPKVITEMYIDVFDKLCDEWDDARHGIESKARKIRLSGQTIILDEQYAINPTPGGGIYVHYRESLDSEWKIAYRTNWNMDRLDFISALSMWYVKNSPLGATLPRDPKRVRLVLNEKDALNAAITTPPN